MNSYFQARNNYTEKLRREVWELYDDLNDRLYNPPKDEKWIDYIGDLAVEIGHDILENNPRGKIVSVGQSPAPSVLALEMEAGYRRLTAETSYLPFSYRVFTLATTSLAMDSDNKTDEDAWREIKEDIPATYYFGTLDKRDRTIENYEDAPDLYEKTLKLYSLTPKEIVEYNQSTGEKTSFVDISRNMRGMASLAYIMLTLAKRDGIEKDFREAIDIQIYFNRELGLIVNKPSAIAVPGFDPIPCKSHELTSMLGVFVLGGTPRDGRMVAEYPPENWDELPGKPEGTPEFLDYIEKSLRPRVQNLLEKKNLLPKQKVKASQKCTCD